MPKTEKEVVQPIKITDNATGATYELDFSRDSIRFADAREFEVEDVRKYPGTKIPELFYYAFRKNHKSLAKNQTDALLDKLGGLTSAMLERLLLLYNQAALANNIQDDEELAKNAEMTVEL